MYVKCVYVIGHFHILKIILYIYTYNIIVFSFNKDTLYVSNNYVDRYCNCKSANVAINKSIYDEYKTSAFKDDYG